MDSPVSPSGSRPRWHCAWTWGGQEGRAYNELAQQSFEAYLPLHQPRNHRPIEPLWPGYVFVRFDRRWDPWGAIRHTRGIGDLLVSEGGVPLPLPEGVIEELISRTSARRVVDDPGNLPFPTRIAPGTPVRLVGGVWDGLATVTAHGRQNRLSVLMSLFNREVVTEVRNATVAVA